MTITANCSFDMQKAIYLLQGSGEVDDSDETRCNCKKDRINYICRHTGANLYGTIEIVLLPRSFPPLSPVRVYEQVVGDPEEKFDMDQVKDLLTQMTTTFSTWFTGPQLAIQKEVLAGNWSRAEQHQKAVRNTLRVSCFLKAQLALQKIKETSDVWKKSDPPTRLRYAESGS